MVNKVENSEHQISCSPFDAGVNQSPFSGQARSGFEQYSSTFGKYLDKADTKPFSEEEKLKRERAKRANRIYKQVCEDLRLKACFFNNFGDWSEYVDGKMSDDEFQSHAVSRAQQMMLEN